MALTKSVNSYLNERKNFDNLVLIDGDIIVYRSGFAAETNIYSVYDPDSPIPFRTFNYKKELNAFLRSNPGDWHVKHSIEVDSLANTLHTVKITINSIKERCKANQVQVFLTGKNNFREEIAVTAEYKGTRPDRKPVHYDAIRSYLINTHKAKIVDNIEADDAIGIESQLHESEKVIIASLDKDLDTVPGWHFNWVKGDLYYVDEIEAQRNLWMQMIVGDRSDNIIGLYRKGEVYASKLLNGIHDPSVMKELVYEEYKKEFDNPKDRFYENLALLYILR